MSKKRKFSKSPGPIANQNQAIAGKATSPQEVAELIDHLPDEQRAQVAQELVERYRIEQTFIGPLPPPGDFAKYDQVIPGAANRILSMAEKEQQIRADSQDKILANDRRRIDGAIWLGISLIAVAGIATWQGYIGIAVPLGLVGFLSTLFRQLRDWLDSRASSK